MSGASNSLEAFLAQSRERIDKCLDQVLPSADEAPVSLHEGMRYAVFSGGKRLRPAMAFAGALAVGGDPEDALPAAAAVELVHTYSLVHDDLPAMDDDDERRGRPTVHVRWDEATAILVGSALFAEAFARLASERIPPVVVERLARAAGSRGLLGGQADDLAFEPGSADLAVITGIHARKTAALFEFSAWSGARLGGLEGPELERIASYGHHYGLGFQLVDDLLDADSEECSVLSVLDAETTRQRVREEVERALAALQSLGVGAWALRGLAEHLTERLP
ncbi:MAG: polyprenyl synthetase family protein [Myxococcota bacterium]